MSKPVVLFPDPVLWAVTFLRGALELREETYAAGVSVGSRPPHDGALPHVSVRLSPGGGVDRSADLEAPLRVTVWHSSEAAALALAELCRALLDAFTGDASARVCRSTSNPFTADDPDNGDQLASFNAAAHMRPVR